MAKTHLSYHDAGYDYKTWVKPEIPVNEARSLSLKAESLWDAVFEGYKCDKDIIDLRMKHALARYGRTLKSMFDCPLQDQPTPTCRQLVNLFIEGWCEMFEFDLENAKRIVDDELGKWRFLI